VLKRTKQDHYTNMQEDKIDLKKTALRYLEKGLSVIPVGPDKIALFPWKEFTERRPRKEEIEKWWTDNPKAGIAIITGQISNLTVVDVERGGLSDYLPKTMIVRTGGSGLHFYYQYTNKFKNAVRIRDLTDIRNDGGYVIAPPSRHASKRRYKFLKPVMDRAPFPEHLFLTEKIKSAKNNWDELLKGAEKGERNASAAKVVGLFLTKVPYSLWENIAWPAILNWNQYNKPPLPEKELRGVYDSIASRVVYRQEDNEKQIRSLEELSAEYKKKLKEIEDGIIQAVPTGFTILDTHLNGGWRTGDLILIGARPSVGKTSLALTFALNAALQKKTVLFFSIEMTSLDIYERLLSFVSKIPCSEIIQGNADTKELTNAYTKIAQLPIYIAELSTADSLEVIEISKKFILERKIDLIVVDYLQFLRDKNKSNSDSVRVGAISKNLKMLARMTGIPVMCPTQLNRKPEERTEKMPRLSDLRDSGSLEQDADVVLLIHRAIEGDTKNEVRLSIAKNRKGMTGEIKLSFDLRSTRFI
jgi:archaellum biogenesis ATPase FlaH